jgi:hypothetical protein
MRSWRCDQGRLAYFQLAEVPNLAQALSAFDGQTLTQGDDPDSLRTLLEEYSERPFLPSHYKVWRNYSRVFGFLMLATKVGEILVCTDLCKKVASGALSGDDYLLHIAKNFSYPSPVFEDYEVSGEQVWPFCAVIKLLISNFIFKDKPIISIDQIIDELQGNSINGTETLGVYKEISSSGYKIQPDDDAYRQIRELIRFISQFSFLKWDNPHLILDVASKDEALKIATAFEPVRLARMHDRSTELLQRGSVSGELFSIIQPIESTLNFFDIDFTEGSRAKALHLRIERSSKLREMYFARAMNPSVCNMCTRDTLDHYPWTDRIIEVHHLLPLSSPVKVEKQSTSLKDVVGLCPTCHRATHKFYSNWLKDKCLADFKTHTEAKETYNLAKSYFVS